MIRSARVPLAVFAAACAFALIAPELPAQDALPNAMQGFGRDRKEPVKIEANSLEIRDKENYAIFEGNVVVKQGESTMRAPRLKVYYEGSAMRKKADKEKGEKSGSVKSVQTTKDGKKDNQRIKKIEALGGIVITSKDQKATGDFGVFDMPTNTATITGNVVVTQGPNIMKADKIIVDLNTGLSRLESAGRVQGLFVPGSVKDKKDKEPK
jgi:lipopolysaccharide export system protein LptA